MFKQSSTLQNVCRKCWNQDMGVVGRVYPDFRYDSKIEGDVCLDKVNSGNDKSNKVKLNRIRYSDVLLIKWRDRIVKAYPASTFTGLTKFSTIRVILKESVPLVDISMTSIIGINGKVFEDAMLTFDEMIG